MYNQVVNSPDLESILNDQFGRLWNREQEVHSKIRESKHTSKHLTAYLEKRAEIEAKYIKEIINLSDNYYDKINESQILSNVWHQILNNDKLQCDHRRKYIENLRKQQEIFSQSYQDEKTKENDIAKQIENDKKVIQNSQRKMDKVIKDIESVQFELKRMDDKRKQERRDEFNEKELKRYKELRIKLSKLESKQIEKSTAHWTTKNSQSKAMGENMKTFLSDQINHINTIKQGLLYHTKYESELHNKETEINNKKLAIIAQINPVEDLLDWISSINPSSSNNNHENNKKLKSNSKLSINNNKTNEENVNTPSPWISVGAKMTSSITNKINKIKPSGGDDIQSQSVSLGTITASEGSVKSENNISINGNYELYSNDDNNARPRSASLDFIPTGNAFNFTNIKCPDLFNSPLIKEYWINAFPSYVDDNDNYCVGQSLSVLHESPYKTRLYSGTVDDDKLLMETALDLNNFKSLYNTKSGYGLYSSFNQLFPCNISYKKLDTFYLKRSEWNRIYFEFLILGSNFFHNVSPHVNHIWQILIPKALNISKLQVKTIINSMEPITQNMNNKDKNYLSLNHYLWLISYRTRFEFDSDQEYSSWLRRQLTIITACIAWNMHKCQIDFDSNSPTKSNILTSLQWQLFDKHQVDYQQIIPYLSNQCMKIINFADKNPGDSPIDNNELHQFIRNIDCLMGQINDFNLTIKSPQSSKLNRSRGSHQGQSTTQTETDFEEQSEIEYLSDEDDDDDNDEEEKLDQLITSQRGESETPSLKTKKNTDDGATGYVSKYNIPFPKHIARFVLWNLLNTLITTQEIPQNRSKTSIDGDHSQTSHRESISEKLELKIEEVDEDDNSINDINNINDIDEKLMLHSKIISLKSQTTHVIDYNNLNIIPGTIEPHSRIKVRKIIGGWNKFVDSFESAYCELFQLNSYLIWVFMAKLTIDISLDYIEFDLDGITMLESIMSTPDQSHHTINQSSPLLLEETNRKTSEASITTIDTEDITDSHNDDGNNNFIASKSMNDIKENENKSTPNSKDKPKRSTKYHINKKWGKLKKRMSTSSKTNTPKQSTPLTSPTNSISEISTTNNTTPTQSDGHKKKKRKFRPKKLARKIGKKIGKKDTPRTEDTPNIQIETDTKMTVECMKIILMSTWVSMYECMKENGVSMHDDGDQDSIISKRVIKWILGHLQNWLYSYMSYPLSIAKDYFHLFMAGQALINTSIIDSVHSVEYVMIAATHIKYDAIYDSIIDARYKRRNSKKLNSQELPLQSMDELKGNDASTPRSKTDTFAVNEWQMFVDALINWMDIESNNNKSIFEQYQIHPRIGQFIMVTLCQRFTIDFKHCIFNTDPFKLKLRKQRSSSPNVLDEKVTDKYGFIRNFIDEKLIALCGVARNLQNNMMLNKTILFPDKLIHKYFDEYPGLPLEFHPNYGKIFPSPNYIALSQLGELVDSQSSKMMEYTKSLLLKEDWIGIDQMEPYSASVIDLFTALDLFTDTFFKATRKLEIRTLLSNPTMYEAKHQNDDDSNPSKNKWTVIKLRDSFIGIITACIDYYCEYISSMSGKIQHVKPESEDLNKLNTQNFQKSTNFSMKELYRKSKKAVVNKPRRLSSTLQLQDIPTSLKKKSSSLSSIKFKLSKNQQQQQDNKNDREEKDEEVQDLHLYKQKPEILCTRFESIARAVIKCKSLNHKIKTTWFETSNNQIIIDSKTYDWLNNSIDNLSKTLDHLGNLIAINLIFVQLRLDIVDNLYSSKPAIINDNLCKNDVNDGKDNNKKQAISKGGKIVENTNSIKLWAKLKNLFEIIKINTSIDGFNCIARKTLAIYFLSLRWILLHSNKDRKFAVNDHKVLTGDMIPMIKFWRGYLGNDTIGEIRLLSNIDHVIDLMSKPTQILINCVNSVIEYDQPFAPKKQTMSNMQCSNMRNIKEIREVSISSQSSIDDGDVLSIIDAANNPYKNDGDLFLSSNHKSVLELLPYSVCRERDLILHVLVRRIEKDAQKFVAEQIKDLQNNSPIKSNKRHKGRKNIRNDKSVTPHLTDSDGSFVSCEEQ